MVEGGPKFPKAPLIFSSSFVLNWVPFIPFTADRYLVQQTNSIWTRVIFFPCVWTASFYLFQKYCGLGDYLTFTTPLITWPEFGLAASLGGRSFLDFLIALFGTILLEIPDYPFHLLKRKHDTVSVTDNNDQGKPVYKNTYSSLLKHPVTAYILFMFALYTYNGARNNILPGSMFQAPQSAYIPKSVPVSCVASYGHDVPDKLDYDIWFNESAHTAEAGSKLVLWSEVAVVASDEKEEFLLLQRAKEFAIKHKVYLAMTYHLLGPVEKNKLVVFTKEGDIGIDYNKAHPVPTVEMQPPGELIIPYMDTEEFGRIGVSICFDMNYPEFMLQASKLNIDVMLQPAWSWGPVTIYHTQSERLRAIENGFTLFRCTTYGLSGIYGPTYNVVYDQVVATYPTESYLFYLPIRKRVATLYGYIGDSFSYLTIFITFAALILLIRQKCKSNRLFI
ncbi:hypothetical protein CU097_003265 [Rhizopus azygosporus]|uniref:CN hydrolase domain-containing protein n=1 Tax=Rhizopus azygosporus TaxID=86630 RepID=A0A367K4Z1_RHIAZ|nr:hypothetical protein CU097_003265 [Rhizopus azygosporus]